MDKPAISGHEKVLTVSNMNPHAFALEYAVRGRVHMRAMEIVEELKSGPKKSYSAISRLNIGDSQALGQPPITFIRQVLALSTCPEGLINSGLFPEDVKYRVRCILNSCVGNTIGAYSGSFGLTVVRDDIVNFIEKRDGYPSKRDDIYLSAGATGAIRSILTLLISGKDGCNRTGILIPCPGYPMYAATLTEFNLVRIDYHLDEDQNWNLNIIDLKHSINSARNVCNPRAIVVINPGNPTGQVLSHSNVQDIIRFAHEEHLMILADEVYQHNIYSESSEFHSFKKVACEMGEPYSGIEIASFFSISKGFMGECGSRGGYCEMFNFDKDIQFQLLKLTSVQLSPPISAQVIMDCVVKPPCPGEYSYELFEKEKSSILHDMKAKAKFMTDILNSIDKISCNEVQGAMYAFPRICLPNKAIEAAKTVGQPADEFYSCRLLEETGICVVPGSGFGQKDGTHHIRLTILLPLDELHEVMLRFNDFHQNFLDEFSK